jgi:asparagine synthase (glutamine-hydrolysing)
VDTGRLGWLGYVSIIRTLMCGIAGMFDRSGRSLAAEEDMRQMLAMLRHRGPDEFGILLDGETSLGSARLSIIDLSGGTQPIANEDGSLWIVFNGEIFNYVELRAELQGRGHRFRTSSDTEVILHLFEEYGAACLNRMNGQFSIAIWDRVRRRLFLARDRLGVRPLFYTEIADGPLIFGSEIKALFSEPRVSRELEPSVVQEIFTFWAPLPGQTAFRGIKELPAGHYLVADADTLEVRSWWAPQFPVADQDGLAKAARPFDEVVEQFQQLLIDACRIRLRADVPVGAYLSGGLDSSTIAAVIRRYASNRLITFSIAFSDEQFDESVYQQEMAAHLGTDHHVIRATHADIGKIFPEVVWHAEVPLMRTSPAPMFLLSQLVRETGFKVVLTGEGADEFLGGYDIFKEAKVRRFWARHPESKLRPLLFKRLYPDIRGFGESSEMLSAFFADGLQDFRNPWYSHAIRWKNNRRTHRFLAQAQEFGDEHCQRCLEPLLPAAFDRWEPLARAQYLEIAVFMSQYLLSSQGDRMGMANSVEGRFPFLDVRLVEFCNALEPRWKLRGLREKHLLKEAARPWLPEQICQRRKRPYRAPVHRSFFNESTPDYVGDVLSGSSLKESGLFKLAPVEQLVQKLRRGMPLGETDDMALAGLISTQLLHRQFVRDFRRATPISGRDRVKICRLDPVRAEDANRTYWQESSETLSRT